MANQQLQRRDPTQEQATIQQQEQTVAALVKRYEANIIAALPTHVKPERVLSVIRTAITSNPGLKECSPMSVLSGIVAASRLGLELDPALGQAYLVPRWNKHTKRMEASFQVGYRGKVDLMQRATPGIIVQVRHVRENDDFDLVYEPKPKLIHRINHKKPRGKVVCSYTYVEYPDGKVEVFEPMGIDEALSIRDRFAPHARCPKCWGRKGERERCETCKGTGESEEFTGPWLTDEDEMVRKTCLHRDSKWIPQSPELKDSVRFENRINLGEAPETVVLDLPAEESESAEMGARTETRKEDLKQRIEASKQVPGGQAPAGEQPPAAEGGGNAGSQPPATSQPGATAPSRQTGKRIVVKSLDDVDPFNVAEGDQVVCDGIVYEPNEEATGWRKVGEVQPQPKPQPQPQQQAPQQPQRQRRNAPQADSALNFGGR